MDQFVSKGVLIQDNNCDFVSPLVIVNMKDGGIRMTVDYREVNMQLETTANQLPYQPTLFQCSGFLRTPPRNGRDNHVRPKGHHGQ